MEKEVKLPRGVTEVKSIKNLFHGAYAYCRKYDAFGRILLSPDSEGDWVFAYNHSNKIAFNSFYVYSDIKYNNFSYAISIDPYQPSVKDLQLSIISTTTYKRLSGENPIKLLSKPSVNVMGYDTRFEDNDVIFGCGAITTSFEELQAFVKVASMINKYDISSLLSNISRQSVDPFDTELFTEAKNLLSDFKKFKKQIYGKKTK